MKIIGVTLSARPDSVSSRLVREVLRGAADAGHETALFPLAAGNLRGCTGCLACKRPDAAGCVQRDAMAAYFEALPDAGALVFGAGCYMGYPNGQAWDFMNRHFSLDRRISADCRLPAGKKLVAIFSQAVPDAGLYQANYDALIEPFFGWGFELERKLVAAGQSGEAAAAAAAEAYALGKSL